MRYLGSPGFDVLEVYDRTLSRMQPSDLQNRLRGAAPQVAAEAQRYVESIEAGELSTARVFELADVSTSEMADHYDNRFARRLSPGREIYDQLIVRAQGRCAVCTLSPPSTLDHYLPKKRHSALAVNPDNLVPCCWDCNHTKADYEPTNRSQELLHPYFDDFSGVTWLAASCVGTGAYTVVTFRVDPPASVDAEDLARLAFHFATFDIGSAFALNAANEIAGNLFAFETLRTADGPEAVRADLSRTAMSWALQDRNSWQAATYAALADSDVFINGPFM